jgi:hypothetical protein
MTTQTQLFLSLKLRPEQLFSILFLFLALSHPREKILSPHNRHPSPVAGLTHCPTTPQDTCPQGLSFKLTPTKKILISY